METYETILVCEVYYERKILNVVAQLINRYGLKKFTVDEVATTLRISKKTIYQYFSGKDEMIHEYFVANLESDKQNMDKAMQEANGFRNKLYALVYTNRCYRLSIFVMGEAKQFYPEEWAEIESLRKYKLAALNELLKYAKKDGIIKDDVHFGILTAMLERSSDIILDTDFLLENKLHVAQAIDAALDIILYGIEKENKDDK